MPMVGMDKDTGVSLSELEHIQQSVVDILTTPIGSRLMRRDYGSRLYQLVDSPMTAATILEIYAATIEALAQWEPRIAVSKVSHTIASTGTVQLTIYAELVIDGQPITLEGIELG